MTRLPARGLTCLCLLLCLGCSAQNRLIPCPVVERVTPPTPLLRPIPEPQWTGAINGDLVDHIQDLRTALRRCNADKAALRAWTVEENMESPGE